VLFRGLWGCSLFRSGQYDGIKVSYVSDGGGHVLRLRVGKHFVDRGSGSPLLRGFVWCEMRRHVQRQARSALSFRLSNVDCRGLSHERLKQGVGSRDLELLDVFQSRVDPYNLSRMLLDWFRPHLPTCEYIGLYELET